MVVSICFLRSIVLLVLWNGPLKKITLTTLFYGTSFPQDYPTTTQAKDATSASKKNYLSSTNLHYHHSINVMNMCPHATTETKHYCVAIEQSLEILTMPLCKFVNYINDGYEYSSQ